VVLQAFDDQWDAPGIPHNRKGRRAMLAMVLQVVWPKRRLGIAELEQDVIDDLLVDWREGQAVFSAVTEAPCNPGSKSPLMPRNLTFGQFGDILVPVLLPHDPGPFLKQEVAKDFVGDMSLIWR
jgi:hypothetical protein